ncbi:retrovirus-related Pol polyprotein from transposon opus [Trichonephila clavipes]|nr:retrovirus-related Pol polyprotein from transposon opus [Trichonephila clavipes]
MRTVYTPVLNHPLLLYTDASDTIIGACHEQNDENEKGHPIAFYSKKNNQMPNELVYDRARGLCCAKCIEKFDCWIFGSQIQVVSNHNPLTFLTKGLPHGTNLALQLYDLRIIYSKVKYHVNADTLSRLPFDD